MDETPTAPPAQVAETPSESTALKKKKKSKVRSAWISFIGRIVAQIIGAVASVVLAVMYLQKTQSTDAPTAERVSTIESPAARPVPRPADGRITLAVLPLDNYSGDTHQDFFADGMTEALIADLAQIEGLRVISRTSVMPYRTTQKSMPQIANELGADVIVEGSVVRSGDRVRVTAQLIDGGSDHHVWARSYEHTLRDVLALQGLVAAEIAKAVKGALTPLQQGRLAGRRAIDPAVYDLYLRGRQAWSLRTADGFAKAVSFFEEAIEQDPTFALAYSGLSDVYVLPSTRANPAGAINARSKALAAATKALQLDDTLAEAHTSRAGL